MEARTIPMAVPSRLDRIRGALDPGQWRRAIAIFATVAGLHIVGFVLLFAVVVPHRYALGAGAFFGVGLGMTAYTLGLRHAFDADHIAAIDSTTRRLMSRGQRPLGVGFFFALGHSSVVFALATVLSLGVRGLSGAIADRGSTLHAATGLIGPAISGTFLIVIGLLNLTVLVGLVRIFRGMRSGEFSDSELQEKLEGRGLLARLYGRATGAVTKSWHMYPVGLLFGLGFDTATEVALLATAGSAAAGGLPFAAILCLPVLFAAGMSLFDTIDGAFMNFAYGWAFSEPVRKVFYNLTVTTLSVAVALLVGMAELASALINGAGLTGQPWDFLSGFDLNRLGYAMIAIFALTWAIAAGVWRLGRIEERWSVRPARGSRA